MIKINEQLKGKKNASINYKNFPHLFEKFCDDYICEEENYYQCGKFWYDFDNEYNLIVETVLSQDETKAEILKVLNKHKEFCNIIISKEKQKLASINEMLKGVENG